MIPFSMNLWVKGSPRARDENLTGKTIPLWAEQGFGDTIEFLRYVPLVTQAAGLTILRVPTMLRSLAQTLDRPVSLITFGDALPPHDYNCPLMSLPLAFGTTLESIRANVPYLSTKPDQIERCRKELGPRTRAENWSCPGGPQARTTAHATWAWKSLIL